MDALDAALTSVRVEGSMVGRSLVEAPWGLEVDSAEPCLLAAVVRGEAWLRHGDAEPMLLEEGAVVVACGGVPLHVGDHAEAPADVRIADHEACWDVVTGEHIADRHRTGSRTWGPPDAPVEVILGAYRAVGALYDLLTRDLPPVLLIQPDPLVAPALTALSVETQDARPGQQVVVDRLMELLLFAAVRAWLASPAATDTPRWATALADPVVGPALQAMHDDPARRWTVAELAELGASSRAWFARRFRSVVGEPPLAYLTRWRMAVAADLLRSESSLSLAAVAERVGYADAFAFSTAFSRVRGQSPTAHRRSA